MTRPALPLLRGRRLVRSTWRFWPVLLLGSLLPAAEPVRLTVGPAREIVPDLIGFNGNMLSQPQAWSDPAMLDAFRRTGARLFRYPAGTLANTWDWDRGWLDATVPAEDLIDWVRAFDRGPDAPQRYPLEEVAKLHRATGTTVVFVLNLLTRDLEHSLRGLRRARDLGMPVTYVEMGNELYFNLPLESRVFPTPEDYGRRCAQWITALKAEFPGVKCALVSGGRAGHPRSDQWTKRALSTCPNADAIVIHAYTPSGLAAGARRELAPGQEGTLAASALPVEDRQRQELELLRQPDGWARMTTTARAAAQRALALTTPPGVEIWFTEWNLRADQDAVRGTWANTLFTATFQATLLEDPRVRLTHFHNLVGGLFAALHTGENDLAHVRGRTLRTTPYTPTAGGLGVSLIARAATGHTRAEPLRLASAAELRSADQTAPALLGWKFSGGPRSRAVLIHLGDTERRVSVDAAFPETAEVETYSTGLDTYITGPDSVPPRRTALGSTLRLPPASVTLITFP